MFNLYNMRFIQKQIKKFFFIEFLLSLKVKNDLSSKSNDV